MVQWAAKGSHSLGKSMVVQPHFAAALGLSQVLFGRWLKPSAKYFLYTWLVHLLLETESTFPCRGAGVQGHPQN